MSISQLSRDSGTALEEGGGRRYEACPEAVDEAFDILRSFLGTTSGETAC